MAHNTEFRLTDDLERRMVREMAREQMHNGSILQDLSRSTRHAINAVRGMLTEVNFRMGDIGEARYS